MTDKNVRTIVYPYTYEGANATITLTVEEKIEDSEKVCNMEISKMTLEKHLKYGKYIKFEATKDEIEITIDEIKIKVKMPSILEYTEYMLYDFVLCPEDIYPEAIESTISAFIHEIRNNPVAMLLDIIYRLFDMDREKLKCKPSIDNAREIKIEKNE